jgi:hypothetical protein
MYFGGRPVEDRQRFVVPIPHAACHVDDDDKPSGADLGALAARGRGGIWSERGADRLGKDAGNMARPELIGDVDVRPSISVVGFSADALPEITVVADPDGGVAAPSRTVRPPRWLSAP